MRCAPFALTLLLAACGDPGGDYPALAPIDTLLEPQLPDHAVGTSPTEITAGTTAAGAATRRHAAAIGMVPADAELLARAAALRERAAALRQAGPGV